MSCSGQSANFLCYVGLKNNLGAQVPRRYIKGRESRAPAGPSAGQRRMRRLRAARTQRRGRRGLWPRQRAFLLRQDRGFRRRDGLRSLSLRMRQHRPSAHGMTRALLEVGCLARHLWDAISVLRPSRGVQSFERCVTRGGASSSSHQQVCAWHRGVEAKALTCKCMLALGRKRVCCSP